MTARVIYAFLISLLALSSGTIFGLWLSYKSICYIHFWNELFGRLPFHIAAEIRAAMGHAWERSYNEPMYYRIHQCPHCDECDIRHSIVQLREFDRNDSSF